MDDRRDVGEGPSSRRLSTRSAANDWMMVSVPTSPFIVVRPETPTEPSPTSEGGTLMHDRDETMHSTISINTEPDLTSTSLSRLISTTTSSQGTAEMNAAAEQVEREPMKRGEIGFRDSVHGASVLPIANPPSTGVDVRGSSPNGTRLASLRANLKKKLPPWAHVASGLFLAVATIVGSIVAYAVALSIIRREEKSQAEMSEPVARLLPNGTVVWEQHSKGSIDGISTAGFFALIFGVVFLCEALFLYFRSRKFYAFFRRRRVFADFAARGVNPSPSNYRPGGLAQAAEIFFRLPSKQLLAPVLGRSNHRFSVASVRSMFSLRSALSTAPGEDEIQRAHRDGAAPVYGSPDMRLSKILLKGPRMRGNSVRRFRMSWRSGVSTTPAAAEDGSIAAEEADATPDMREVDATSPRPSISRPPSAALSRPGSAAALSRPGSPYSPPPSASQSRAQSRAANRRVSWQDGGTSARHSYQAHGRQRSSGTFRRIADLIDEGVQTRPSTEQPGST